MVVVVMVVVMEGRVGGEEPSTLLSFSFYRVDIIIVV